MRLTFRGTNTGDILTSTPIPATGKQVSMTEILIVRIAQGKVVELWSEADYLGGYQQLGLIPVPQPVGS